MARKVGDRAFTAATDWAKKQGRAPSTWCAIGSVTFPVTGRVPPMPDKNAALWRSNVQGADVLLFVASYLRAAMLSNGTWRADVLNRKGTIALRTGWVHGSRHDLTAITG